MMVITTSRLSASEDRHEKMMQISALGRPVQMASCWHSLLAHAFLTAPTFSLPAFQLCLTILSELLEVLHPSKYSLSDEEADLLVILTAADLLLQLLLPLPGSGLFKLALLLFSLVLVRLFLCSSAKRFLS